MLKCAAFKTYQGIYMKNLIFAAAVILSGSFSMADQCQMVSKDKAEKALIAITQTQSVQSLCELCGERIPLTVTVKSVGMRNSNYQNFWEVMINDNPIDLAYTYVNGLNLAKLTGCTTQGVTSSLEALK